MLREEDLLMQPPPSPHATERAQNAAGAPQPIAARRTPLQATRAPQTTLLGASQQQRMAALSRPVVLSRALAPETAPEAPRQRTATMARPVSAPLAAAEPPHRRRINGMALLSSLLVIALFAASAGIAYALLAQHGVVTLPTFTRTAGSAKQSKTPPAIKANTGTTATPATGAGTVTVTFTPATRTFTPSGAMTACPSGCDLTASLGSAQRTITTTANATGQLAYYAVDLQVVTPSGYDGLFAPTASDGNTCANGPFRLTMSAGQSRWIQCQPATQPVAPNDFYNETYAPVFYQNPKASYLDTGSHYVTPADCANASNTASAQAQSWAQGYAPAKQQVVARSIHVTASWCTPGISHAATTLTGNATITVSYESFAPPDASALASQRLNAQLPAGYAWKAGSASACTPTWSAPANGTTFTVTCVESGVAIAQWTDALKTQLANALAGHTVSAALAACNAFAGVQPGSCSISPHSHPGASLPASASAITIAPAVVQ